MNIFMKQIIRYFGIFVTVCALISCEPLGRPISPEFRIYFTFSVMNMSSQDIEVECVKNNINQDKFKYSIAKGDTNRYDIDRNDFLKLRDPITYRKFQDQLDTEEFSTSSFGCIDRLNTVLAQIDIYDANENKVRSWTRKQWKDNPTPSRSPFYGYPPYWKENWSYEVNVVNAGLTWIYFTYTITDEDLIPEESAEE